MDANVPILFERIKYLEAELSIARNMYYSAEQDVERLERDNAVVRESNVTMNNEAARLRAENERLRVALEELRDGDRYDAVTQQRARQALDDQ